MGQAYSRIFNLKSRWSLSSQLLDNISNLCNSSSASRMTSCFDTSSGIDGYFTHDVSVGSISYIFPNRAILKDIAVKKATGEYETNEHTKKILEQTKDDIDVSDIALYINRAK